MLSRTAWKKQLTAKITNNGDEQFEGTVHPRGFWRLGVKLLDTSGAPLLDSSTNSPAASISLAPGESLDFILSVNPTATVHTSGRVWQVGYVVVPDDQKSPNMASLNDPNVELRKWPSMPVDATVYSSFVDAFLSETPVENYKPSVQGGLTFETSINTQLANSIPAADSDGDDLTYVIVEQPEHGTLILNEQDGSFTYNPQEGFSGIDRFRYKVNDGSLDSRNAMSWIKVSAAAGPVTTDDQSSNNQVSENVDILVLQNDTGNIDPSSVHIVGTANPGVALPVPGQGLWTVSEQGVISFSPEVGFASNPTSIQYTVKDSAGNPSNPATVRLTYVPSLISDFVSDQFPGSEVSIDVLLNDTGGEPVAPQFVQIVGTSNPGETLPVSGQGEWSIDSSTGTITFTPEFGFASDPAGIEYVVVDAEGDVPLPVSVDVDYRLLMFGSVSETPVAFGEAAVASSQVSTLGARVATNSAQNAPEVGVPEVIEMTRNEATVVDAPVLFLPSVEPRNAANNGSSETRNSTSSPGAQLLVKQQDSVLDSSKPISRNVADLESFLPSDRETSVDLIYSAFEGVDFLDSPMDVWKIE